MTVSIKLFFIDGQLTREKDACILINKATGTSHDAISARLYRLENGEECEYKGYKIAMLEVNNSIAKGLYDTKVASRQPFANKNINKTPKM